MAWYTLGMSAPSNAPTPQHIKDYRQALLPALRAVKAFRGTEASAERVLNEAIRAENWIKETFPGRSVADAERDLTKQGRLPSFNDILGRCLTRLTSLFRNEASVSGVLSGLSIPIREVSGVLVPPAESEVNPEAQGDRSDQKKGTAFKDRFLKLLTELQQMGVYADDLIVHRGQLLKSQARQASYLLVEIPRIQADILVCDQVGEATFVSTRPLGLQAYLQLTKPELMVTPGVHRVAHYNDEQWSREIVTHLGSKVLAPKIDISNMLSIRDGMKARFTAEELVAYDVKARNKFEVDGHKVYAIARGLGLPGRALAEEMWLEVCARVYGEAHPAIAAPLEKAREERRVLDALGTARKLWATEFEKQFTPEQFIALPTWGSTTRRQDVRVANRGLIGIATILGCESEPLKNTLEFLKFAADVWGKDHPVIRRALVQERLRVRKVRHLGGDPERWRKEIEKIAPMAAFIKLPMRSEGDVIGKQQLEIAGLSIDAIARALGVEGSPRSRRLPFLELCAKLWGEDPCFAKELHTLRAHESVGGDLRKDQEKWKSAIKERFTAEQFAQIPWSDDSGGLTRKGVKIAGKGLHSMGRIMGVAESAATSEEGFRGLFVAVWGKDDPAYSLLPQARQVDDKLLSALGTDPQKWRVEVEKKYSPEDFINLPQTGRAQIKIAGLGWFAMSTLLKTPGKKYSLEAFVEMCAQLWGREHPAVAQRLAGLKRQEGRGQGAAA